MAPPRWQGVLLHPTDRSRSKTRETQILTGRFLGLPWLGPYNSIYASAGLSRNGRWFSKTVVTHSTFQRGKIFGLWLYHLIIQRYLATWNAHGQGHAGSKKILEATQITRMRVPFAMTIRAFGADSGNFMLVASGLRHRSSEALPILYP